LKNLTVDKLYQPRGLYVLFFLEMWERFSYWGIQSLLVLYLVRYFLFSDEKSYTLFGAYTALTYAISLLGGIIADRFLGFRKSIVFGGILIVLGNIILALPDKSLLHLGLSLIIGGTGLIKPNSASQLGTLYDKKDTRRDGGFTIFYVGTNIGGIFGPLAYGFFSTQFGWHTAFIISAVGVVIGLAVYLFYGSLFKKSSHENQITFWTILFLYLVLIGLLWLLLLNPEWVGRLLDWIELFTLAGFLYFIYQGNATEKRAIIAIFFMVCFSLFFFACLFQCSTSLLLFIERFVDRQLFNWIVPTETFVSLQPFFLVLLAPLLAKIWARLKTYEPSASKKIVIGLLFASASFVCFMLAALEVTETKKAGLSWILTGNILLSLGELCIAPPALATITQLAPVKLQATLVGSFYLALAFAGYLASLIAKLTAPVIAGTPLKTTAPYFSVYQSIFYLAIAAAVLAYVMSYYWHRIYKVL